MILAQKGSVKPVISWYINPSYTFRCCVEWQYGGGMWAVAIETKPSHFYPADTRKVNPAQSQQ